MTKLTKRQKEFFTKTVEMFEKAGCPTLETEYKPAKKKWRYICNCGEEKEILPHDFKRGRRCKECGAKKVGRQNQTPLEEVEALFSRECYQITEVENKKGRLHYHYVCPNKHTGNMPLHSFKSGHRCKECATEITKSKLKLKIEQVEEIFWKQGCVVIGEYVNYDTPIQYKCSCGENAFGYIGAIKKGIKCGCGYKTGEEHASWNPNLTKEEREDRRKYPEYYKWVQEVYERDDYTCQCCGERGGKLNAHHIYNYSQHKDLRTDLINGITLCELCHKDFHNIYGYQDNNEFQLKEYIDEIHKEIMALVI